MTKRLAVIMDPIETITPHKDSSLAMLLEAQSRGWEIYSCEMNDIGIRQGTAFARLTSLRVDDDPDQWYEKGVIHDFALGDLDVILMRKDPPFDMQYVFATYILQKAEEAGARVVNSPQGLRDANEKVFLTWFEDCIPPTLITRSLNEMQAFIEDHRKVVVKPLDLMGGQSIFVTSADDGNRNVILETVSHNESQYLMLQRYIPDIVTSGDKRILLIDGYPIPLALARIPSAGDHRGNMVAGAKAEVRPLTDRDRWICEQIGPVLRDKKLQFVGIDVIGEYLTEVNVTSPTGIRELEQNSDLRISKKLFDCLETQMPELKH